MKPATPKQDRTLDLPGLVSLGRPHRARLARLLGALLLLLVVAGPIGDGLIERLLPWQRSAYAVLLMVLMPALTLAGAQWAVVVPPFSELSVEALLGGASDLLQHGGGFALSAWVLLAARRVARGAAC